MILPEHESNRLLADAGIPVIEVVVLESPDHAKRQAEAMGYPVALKFSSAAHTHKSEIGGVRLNLANEADVDKGFTELAALRERLDPGARIIMEPMAPTGAEFFVGFQLNPQFGPVISLGLGGIFLELTGEVTFRLLPAKRADFREMLTELNFWPRLKKGFRHLPPVDEEALVDLMERVADFAVSRADLKELDLNPVIALPDGMRVVDATVVLGEILQTH